MPPARKLLSGSTKLRLPLCAPAIIRAVDEGVQISPRGSQNIPTQLSTAIQKFEEVSLIHLGEVELEARASVYASAEATSEDTQELYMEARDKCSEADRKLLQAQQSFESVLKQGDQLVIRAEIANREALEACATAAKRLEEANAALEQVTDKAKKAANIYSDAQLQREAAVESYDRAMQKLAAAEEIVKSSTTQLADAKTATESVLDSLRNAENEANKAITLAMGAGTKAQLAEEELRKSERLMRRARSWSLVTLIAAISIATWGVVRAAANLHYGNVAPIAVTAIAVVVGIVVWRSER